LNADVGHVYDKRFENRDSGNTLSGGVNYNDDLLNTLSLKLEGTGKTSNLNRSQDGYRGAGNISYNHGLADVSLSFDDNLNRRGYYSNIGRKEIEKRKRHERTLKLAVNRGDFNRISEGMAVEFAFNIQRKDITDTADKKDNPLKYQTNVKGDAKGFDIKIGKGVGRRFTSIWEMEYSKNDNGVERKNRRREQTDVATKGSLFLGIGRADTVEFVGWIARTRIDTPAGVANDRDELKFESGVLYTSHFIDNLKTELDFRVLQTHFVNIDVSQSAQNKWMKTYLLSPALVYSPLRALTVIHRVNLYANYITYDFDSDFSPRSNISRRVTSESSIDLALSSRTILKTGAMFEENDYGKLDSKGNKIPSEEGLRRSFDISIEYRFADWLTLSPMYIYAVRHDWSIEADTTSSLRREIDQTYGLDCLLFRRENGSVIIRLKRIIRNTRRYPTRIRNYITVALNYGF
ncbi:MAG: hypothetical protein HOC71_07295, partial [Candidatus Latescibacteria bacterium]|nr:hypothetical protein [Candidatus Latescibacterota bacterium]